LPGCWKELAHTPRQTEANAAAPRKNLTPTPIVAKLRDNLIKAAKAQEK
jgi:hypothetical protein